MITFFRFFIKNELAYRSCKLRTIFKLVGKINSKSTILLFNLSHFTRELKKAIIMYECQFFEQPNFHNSRSMTSTLFRK